MHWFHVSLFFFYLSPNVLPCDDAHKEIIEACYLSQDHMYNNTWLHMGSTMNRAEIINESIWVPSYFSFKHGIRYHAPLYMNNDVQTLSLQHTPLWANLYLKYSSQMQWNLPSMWKPDIPCGHWNCPTTNFEFSLKKNTKQYLQIWCKAFSGTGKEHLVQCSYT